MVLLSDDGVLLRCDADGTAGSLRPDGLFVLAVAGGDNGLSVALLDGV